MKHTPKPWTVHLPTKKDSRLMVLHPDGSRVIASLNVGFHSDKGILSIEERTANAKLIAAAPELFETLEIIAQGYDRNGKFTIGHFREMAYKTIKKATE